MKININRMIPSLLVLMGMLILACSQHEEYTSTTSTENVVHLRIMEFDPNLTYAATLKDSSYLPVALNAQESESTPIVIDVDDKGRLDVEVEESQFSLLEVTQAEQISWSFIQSKDSHPLDEESITLDAPVGVVSHLTYALSNAPAANFDQIMVGVVGGEELVDVTQEVVNGQPDQNSELSLSIEFAPQLGRLESEQYRFVIYWLLRGSESNTLVAKSELFKADSLDLIE